MDVFTEKNSDSRLVTIYQFSKDELNLMREWIDALQDVYPKFIEPDDLLLKNKIEKLIARLEGK
jgi:hypothetical protein